ncbi:hypothetical protein HUF15_40440 [Streptomyces samsunensis]|uniref:DUF6197 family protein n=2 Tax=Streptomyces malaysiensis TaxID=92644 RepID=UPI0015835F5B|nr:hypothetical protein [Streptomyces samsunensis]NUH42890.1 hypothetical protein [Streptomyces samsunensis]
MTRMMIARANVNWAPEPARGPWPGGSDTEPQNLLVSTGAAPATDLHAAVEQMLQAVPWHQERIEQLQYVAADSTAWLLQQTSDLLRTGGWVRGAYERGGGYCLTGALTEAAKRLGVAWEVKRAGELALELSLALRTRGMDVNLIRYNDHLGRRVEQVQELLATATQIAYRYGQPVVAAPKSTPA